MLEPIVRPLTKHAAILCMIVFVPISVHAQTNQFLPGDELDLKLKAPINTWDEAIPLGNGLLGGLLWGQGSTVRLSLDRGDLWDVRIPERINEPDYTWKEIRAEVERGDQGAVVRRFDSTYNEIKYPTKLPGGRLEIDLAEDQTLESFDLDLSEAVGRARLSNGQMIEGFYSARSPVGIFRIPGPEPRDLRLIAPIAVKQLNYLAAKQGEAGHVKWFVQKAAKNLQYAVVVATKRLSHETLVAVTITATKDGSDPLARGIEVVNGALDRGYARLLNAHVTYWHDFWATSRVVVPDESILKHYYLVNYYLGAASRPGAPPMPLQGVWTADGGGLPPWKGDFHHDLNTQMTYVSYLAAGHFEEGAVFLDFMVDLLPELKAFSRKFYEAPGAAVPGVMTLDGKPMGGWIQYSYSPTNGAWVGWMFYRHWLYTGANQDLERGYEFCSELGVCLEHLLKPNPDGWLTLPLSSSPEIHNNSLKAWLVPNSNYDDDCLEALFRGLADMAKAMGKTREARRWDGIASKLKPRLVDPDTDILMFSQNQPFDESHRHHSHMMGLHPFGLKTIEDGSKAVQTINATLDRVNELGTQAWTGYSFSWIACNFARQGRAEEALKYLEIYVKAFILRNGFHVNGDQLKAGFSGFTYRPFTLEGNFLAPEAVHDMLIQSWRGVVRLFPAMPWRWHDAEFDNLRAEGGWIVSARYENNAATWLRFEATRDGTLVLRDNFGGRAITWRGNKPIKVGKNYEVLLKEGDILEATLAKPLKIPSAPEDVWKKLELPAQTHLRKNTLPLRIGANTQGKNQFVGDIARVSVIGRVLTAKQIADIAKSKESNALKMPDLVGCWDMSSLESSVNNLTASVKGKAESVAIDEGLSGYALRLDGEGYLNIPHNRILNCTQGVTLEAWIRPAKPLGAGGARIIDKSPVGAATAYLLDTYPGNSLRLIHRDPHLGYDAQLPVGQWSHVAATINGETGDAALYLNGKRVASH